MRRKLMKMEGKACGGDTIGTWSEPMVLQVQDKHFFVVVVVFFFFVASTFDPVRHVQLILISGNRPIVVG